MNDTNRATTNDKSTSLTARLPFPLTTAGMVLLLALSHQLGCSPKADPTQNLPTAPENPQSIGHVNATTSTAEAPRDTKTQPFSLPTAGASVPAPPRIFNRKKELDTAQLAIQKKQWNLARSALLRMLSADHADSDAILLMANVAAESGDTDQAIELLDEIPKTQPGIAVHALGRAAELCVAAERYDDAVERYLSLIELVPTSALAHRRIAALLNGLGRRHEASRHIRLLCKLGNVHQEELHSLMVLSDTCTEKPLGACGKARQMFSAQEFANAADEIRNNGVVTAYPPAVQALYGRCLAEMQDDERFQQWLSQIDGRTKKCAETWSAIGAWLVNHQRFEEAIRALAEAIRRDPTDVRSYRRMHQSLVALDREQNAKTWEQRQAKLREVTLASNELGTTHQHDLTRYKTVVDGLNSLGRPLESVLWKAIASLHDNQSTQVLSQLNETRVSLVESGRSFPTAEQRLCSLDIENYPDIDIESIASRSDANSQPEKSDWHKIEEVALPLFENIAASVGLTHAYQIASQPQDSHFMIHQSIGGGVAVIDFDLDGDCDLYFSQGAADPPKFTAELSNQLLRQIDGVLIDITDLSGTTETRYSVGVTAGDWNQDGFPDIAVSNIGTNSLLINNGDGTFQREAIDASDRRTLLSTSIAIADLSGDALPDIYQENYIDDPDIAAKPVVDEKGVLQIVAPADYQPAIDEICYNEGTGGRQCKRVSEKDTDRRTGLGIVVSNFDSQPGNEIFVGNDVRPNQLWKRNADARWLDTAPTTGSALGFDGSLTASMGIATGDFDRSGTPDIHVTNFENGPARLYLNRGGSFQDRAMSRNLSKDSYKVLGFGTQALDYNNDGLDDLVVTNGHVENMDLPTSPFKQPFQVFANLGSHFQIQPNLDTSTYPGSLHVGRGLARLDFNSDGKPDVVITHLGETSALLINRTETDHHWLQIRLVGVESERDAIGASITVTSGAQSWTGWALAGDGYLCRNEQAVAFGLGDAEQEASQKLLKVERWSPGGQNLPFAIFQFSSAATDGETIMNEVSLLQSLGQVSASETGEVFRDFIRGHVREMISEVMAAEVTQLCGPKHAPHEGDHYRAGTSPGRVLYEGEREEVVRPRVRRRGDDGDSHEAELATYRAAKDPSQLQTQIIQAIVSGVSSRAIEDIKPNSPGVSRSNVSRLWKEVGHKFVEELRGKNLGAQSWCVLMLDGIRLSSDQTAVVALGIDTDGRKQVLDFVLGSSESLEIASDLMSRIMNRGFTCSHRLYVVLDGSDALRGAVKEHFPDAVVQRCLVHKERNLKAKLSKRHWGEVSRLFTRLRSVQGYEAAKEVFDELDKFIKPINAEAHTSLHEAGEDLLALHRLNVPNTLHRCLLSTNAIENSFRTTRRKLDRVTRFRAETDQASRWLSYALLEAEKGFRRITGCKSLPHLLAALARPESETS